MLGDRVVVMSPRPGPRRWPRSTVGLPRPRRRTDPEVVALREQVLAALGVRGVRRVRSRRAGWLVVALLGAWELYVDLGGADPLILPPPTRWPARCMTTAALLWSNFLVTARRCCSGSSLARAGGLPLAIAHALLRRRCAAARLPPARRLPDDPDPDARAGARAVARASASLPKLVVIALVSFFAVVVTTLAGFAAVDPELLKLMRTFDATRRRSFAIVELPAALPGVFTGAKIAVVVRGDRRGVRRAGRRQLGAGLSVRPVDRADC